MEAERERLVAPYGKCSRKAERKWKESAANPASWRDARPSFRGLELIGAIEQLALILWGLSGPVYVPRPCGGRVCALHDGRDQRVARPNVKLLICENLGLRTIF